jgi:CDP-diacylglycerol---serine O-phosphatidyltransferase
MSELKKGLFRRPKLHDASSVGQDSNLSAQEKKRLKRQLRRQMTLSVLPTLLTLGNGVCGMTAIAVATSANLQWENETKLLVAGLAIFGGMLFDALDGSAARMAGSESEFGAQLDSLCDAITFGAAPAVLVWRFADGEALPSKLVWAIGVLFSLCVLIRLARFNVETEEDDTHEGFEGLPSPAAAGTIAAFAMAVKELQSFHESENKEYYSATTLAVADASIQALQYFVPILALILAYLMVSRLQYPHIFQRLVRGRRSPHQIGQAMFVIVGIVGLYWFALPIAFLVYVFSAPVTQNRWIAKPIAKSSDVASSPGSGS